MSNPDYAIFGDYLWSLLPLTLRVVAISAARGRAFSARAPALILVRVRRELRHHETARTTAQSSQFRLLRLIFESFEPGARITIPSSRRLSQRHTEKEQG